MISEEIRVRFDREVAKYPAERKQSAVMACLSIMQDVYAAAARMEYLDI